MIRYYRLFELLDKKGMKKTDLLDIISSPTLAKLAKGESVTTTIIDKICSYLQCQPNDIMEHYTTKKINGKDVEMYTISKEELEQIWNEQIEREAKIFEENDRREKILKEYAPKNIGIIENINNIPWEEQ